MNAASEILNHYADYGKRQKSVEGQFRTDGQHERQRAGREYDRVRRIHDGGAQQHAHGIEIIGRPRHYVAGAHALVVRVRKAFKMVEEVVAQVELNVAGNADDDPAREE